MNYSFVLMFVLMCLILLFLNIVHPFSLFFLLMFSAGGSVLVQVGEHVKKLGGGASNDRLLQLALGSLLSLCQASIFPII